MGAMIGTLLQVVYALTLVVNMLWSAGLMKLLQFVPMEKRRRQGLSSMLVQVAWRISLALAPWMWFASSKDSAKEWKLVLDNLAEEDDKVRKGGGDYKPLFILGNHTSFFDTVLAASVFSPSVLWRCRTYMDQALFKLPILSTVCLSIGHFPVYFKGSAEGSFSTDKDKTKEVDLRVDEHLSGGGWLCFFPEGQINKNPDVIQVFRYGGMKKAIEKDARLLFFTAVGNTSVWPRKAQVGGLPGKVAYGVKAWAPRGAKALVAELREKCTEEEKSMPDEALLAKYGQLAMQKEYDELQKCKPSGVVSFLMSAAPALAFYLASGVGVCKMILSFV
jgi:1-acyl-sn-glycerol-3-phosphate acyltransferase|mmetsp:Transcript_35311/g.56268  ORF Transcript_35311/g.56268 Transcript_35311/m.56268 type:complete len:333 (-) Transcript_35311:56-1054(-)